MKGTKNIASQVEELVRPTVEGLGYTLWDVEYVKEGTEWYLRITIDSPEGIWIEDCEKVHRAIDPIIDEADPIETSYRLEVSSPGIERELRTDAHIEAFRGEKVEAKLYAAINGKKSYVGILGGIEDGCIVIDDVRIERKNIGGLHVVYDFSEEDA